MTCSRAPFGAAHYFLQNELLLSAVLLFQVMESKDVAHRLLQGMNCLRLNTQLCDITLVVGEARLQAHRVVLASASQLFASLFLKDSKGECGSLMYLIGHVCDHLFGWTWVGTWYFDSIYIRINISMGIRGM